jgi:hypothetical protein
VTATNIAYRLSLGGHDVAYLDFDFGSPTVGAIFQIPQVERGLSGGHGLHSYLQRRVTEPDSLNVMAGTSRRDLQKARSLPGRFVLFPGDQGGAEFGVEDAERMTQRCLDLLLRLKQEYKVVVVDLSAGRSTALDLALRVTARPELRAEAVRWLVFYRWTFQHVVAANGLVHGARGLLDVGSVVGHDRRELENAVRFVKTAVPALGQRHTASRAVQASWLQARDEELRKLAERLRLGHSATLGKTPMEPMLQWQERIISDVDVADGIANRETKEAFVELAGRLFQDAWWEGL